MNKLGVHALVWEKGWSHEECARAIANTAQVGFDLIEVPALDPASIDTAFTAKELQKAGIGATSSLGLDADTDISSNDRDKEKRGEARLLQAVAVIRDIGATHMCGILEFGVPEIRRANHRRGRQALLRNPRTGGRDRGGQQHHARPRGGQPL